MLSGTTMDEKYPVTTASSITTTSSEPTFTSTKVRFVTEEKCKTCDTFITHVYDCTCNDYWGYCKNKACTWYECKPCDKRVPPPPTPSPSRPYRTDEGTEKERNALNKLLSGAFP